MGLLDVLKGIGGAIPIVGPAISAISSVAGKQAQGKTQGQISQAQLQQAQDRNAIDAYQAAQQAQMQAGTQDLQRKQFEQGNRSTTAKQALIGALLGGGVTPTSIGPSGASGGLLRSLNGNPDALAALKMLGSQGSTAQSAPVTFSGGNVIPAPTLTPLPKVDKGGLMSTLASIGQLVGAASPYIKKPGNDDAPDSAGDWGGYG